MGQFNLPISMRYAFEIGVSLIRSKIFRALHFEKSRLINEKSHGLFYSHGINIIPKSWEGASLPMLIFLSELMGRHLRSATTNYFWKKLSTFFSSLILLTVGSRNIVNKCLSR